MIRPHTVLRRLRPLATALVAATIAVSAVAVPSAVVAAPDESPARTQVSADLDGDPPSPADAAAIAETAGQHASTVYEEAMAHEQDQLEFEPGDRVEIGFEPRPGDAWPVDNKAPTDLPDGRASGEDMADSPQGSQWAEVGSGQGGAPVGPPGPALDGGGTAASSAPAPDPGSGPSPTPGPVDAPSGAAAIEAVVTSSVAPADGAPPDIAAANGLRRQVFGFLPYWEVSGASSKLNYDVLSTIAYFSVGADSTGNLKKKDADGTSTTGWGGWTSTNMSRVIESAHLRGTRVVLTISVFAWTSGQASVQRALLGSSSARLRLARQAAAAVRDRGADGINLDFEPVASGYDDEFVALLRTFRTELNRVHAGYQLTYDTTGYIGNYPLEASVASGAADAIFIMGYDYRTASSSYAGSVDPLSGQGYDLADTVRAYTARVAPSRVILGIPWYGRAWSTVSDGVRAKSQSGAQYGYSTAVNYENVVDLVARYGRRWDASEQAPYVVYRRENCTATYGCVTSWRQVYYDDAASMKARYALVNDYGLRGAGMWALGYDGGHAELYRAVSESFLVDKSGPQAGIRMLPSIEPDEGFVVTWSAKDTSAIAAYDVQASIDGGPWTAWLTGTTATSDVWSGRDGRGYAFRVRARDARGNLGAWNVTSTWSAGPELAAGGFGKVSIDGLSYRSGPDTTATRLGTLPVNTIVAVTGGPVAADGYTWWEVTQPVREWGPVSFVERGVWIAGSSPTATYVTAYRAPNSTTVGAGLRDLDFGPDGSAIGPAGAVLPARQLSPNGDGSGDKLRLRWTGTIALETLSLNVYRADGLLLGSRAVTGLGAGDHAWDWDGKVGAVRVPDGRYVLQLVGTAAGATYRAPSARPVTASQVAAFGILVDTVAPKLTTASASTAVVSPNADGVRDTVRLALAATGSTRWAITIGSTATGVVRSLGGAGTAAAYTWGGTRDDGSRVPDGAYQATLIARDAAGNSARKAFAIVVDSTPPAVTPTTSPASFSPDGDGAWDSILLAWTASERSSGTARIWRGSTLVRSWTLTSRTSWATTWNGRAASGAALRDGTYVFKVDVRDAGGNRTVAQRSLRIDRTAGYLRWSGSFFPQDGDSLAPTAMLSFRLARSATTTLRLYDATGRLVRTVWAGRAQAAGTRTWAWNGKLADGSFVPQGRYRAELTATSSLGTAVLNRSVVVAAFAVMPSATTVKAGQKLTIAFTTVERLSVRPTVTFAQPGLAPVTVTATRLADGSYRASFTVRAGTAGPGSVRISARDSGGRTNTTTLPVTIAR